MNNHLSLLGTAALFGFEWWLLRLRMTDHGGSWVFLVPTALWVVVLGSRLWEHKRNDRTIKITSTASFLHLFVRIVKVEGGTRAGVIHLLFILFNITWTQDLLLEVIKRDGTFLFPLFTALWLIAPFVWNRPYRPTPTLVFTSARKRLIAGLSFHKIPEKKLNFHSNHYPGWGG